MSEEIIKDEMRLFALESVVCQLCAGTFLQMPPGSFEKTRSAWLESARKQAFAGADAATSDLYSAELEAALDRLGTMIKSHLQRVGK